MEPLETDFSLIAVLAEAWSHLTPKSEKVRQIINNPQTLWREPPYSHERRLALAFASVIEKNTAGDLNEIDVHDVATLFSWIVSLKAGQVKQEQSQNRTMEPVLLSVASKRVFGEQVKKLNDKNFFDQKNWEKMLISFLRGHLFCLSEARLFRQGPANISFLEEEIKQTVEH